MKQIKKFKIIYFKIYILIIYFEKEPVKVLEIYLLEVMSHVTYYYFFFSG